MNEPQDRADLDAAYAAAVRALADDAAAQRRRAAVLAAVRAAGAAPQAARAAANQPRWRTGSAWWGGTAAACVLGLSTLLVWRHADELAARPDAAPAPAARRSAGADTDAAPRPAEPADALKAATVPPPPAAPPARPPRPAAPIARAAAPAARAAPFPAQGMAGADRAEAQRSAKADAPATAAAPPEPARRATGSLLAAARDGDLEGARRLLAAGAAPDAQDGDGRTALAQAVLRSDAPLAALLLAHGADRLRPDRQGLTPMDHAATIGNPEVLAALNRR